MNDRTIKGKTDLTGARSAEPFRLNKIGMEI